MTDHAYAEDAVLAGLMARNEIFHEVAPLLGEEQFTTPRRRRIWAAIRDRLREGQPADVVTMCDALPGDASELIDLAKSMATGSSVASYAALVREHWRMREAGSIAQRLLSGAREREPGAVEQAIAELMALNAHHAEHEYTGKQILALAFEVAQQAFQNGGAIPGITTGLQELDEILGGWHDSDLTFIGGRPAMGKTAFMLGLAEAAADSGRRVGIVSAEQPAVQLGIRRAALASGVGAQAIRAGNLQDEDWSKITAGISRARDRHLRVFDRSAVSLDELVSVARKWKHNDGLDVLFIDYAQRITVPGADRITEVSQIARGLKNLARDLNIPVVSLAQVVKGVDSRPDKRPNAGDLANSDELTREADQVLMLYRDEVYNRESPDKGVAEILIEKNRHGPTGFKRVRFVAETMAFESFARRADWEEAA
ncbi:DnaB domain protein helicase domain protein [Pseudoxanthomonas suwonensis 11-1]|uniref:DNA 5'-3' helicase n=1 Tax=Pseudoxanthomonas suwonensis (strain 11-1) TaxID=743721 RepID=E6WS51_PSEUU|nr:DnaB-like helicase C-terminal domain-containing protein [Pseudoxanthomonas suwonensis]ADV27000.1 DnaB domain protein helicase domain protein [Pseudoxanthomonas suwonensis 11-1]